MSLADVQRAVAELVCDGASLDAYRRDPRAWLAARVMTERERRVLEGIDAGSLAAFHEIHARDRAFFVEAVLPRTTARLGATWAGEYFSAFPYGADDTRVEARRFVAWLDRADPATRALADVELATYLLLDAPAFRPVPAAWLQGSHMAQLAQGLAVVPTDFDVRPLFDDPRADAPARSGCVVLRRDDDGVTTAWLEGAHAEVLRAVARGDASTLRAPLEGEGRRRALDELLLEGVLR